jgi:hypothetical protein
MANKQDFISRRWPNAEAFYAERDHRTELAVHGLRHHVHSPAEIHVAREFAEDITVQRMALLAANLTARWCRDLRLSVPNVPLAPPLGIHGEQTLVERLRRELREADPFGTFSVGDLTDASSASLCLRIGPHDKARSSFHESDYFIDACGWTALGWRSHREPSYRREPATAPAAALAAAVGAADLFKRAAGHPPQDWLAAVAWCTWNHALNADSELGPADPAVCPAIDLGNLLLAGVGAVGSALLYILGLMQPQGKVTVLDKDRVDASNLNRSPLFTAEDAALSRAKTEVARRLLLLLGIQTETVNGTWHEHGERLSREPFDAWVSLTNEQAAWAEVPFLLPPVVLHGTTTSGWGVSFGRHIPRAEDCTACRLPQPHAEFRGPCAEAAIDSAEEGLRYRASLPFLSTVSAALIAAELLKLRSPRVSSLPNAVYADFRNGLPAVVARRLKPTRDCRGCQILSYPLWVQRGGQSRYSDLSLG